MMTRMIKDPFARLNLDREVLTVSQLNGRARVLLEDVFSNIWVEGEISNLARPASGHVYFTLKDSGAQVRCALFRNNAARVRQALKDGLARRLRHPGERLRQQAQRLDDLDMRMRRAFERSLNTRRERLIRLETRLAAQHPGRQLAMLRQRLDSLAERLPRAMREGLKARRMQLQNQMQTLHVVSPLATLGRGYSILLDEKGNAVRRAAQTQNGQRLTARLGEGELQVRVEDNHLTPVTLSLLD